MLRLVSLVYLMLQLCFAQAQQRIVFVDSVSKAPAIGIYVFGDKSSYYTDSSGAIKIYSVLEQKLFIKHPNYSTKFLNNPFPDTIFLNYQLYQTKEVGFEVKKWYRKSSRRREINQLYSTIFFIRANLKGRSFNKLIIPIIKRKTEQISKGNYLMVELREPNYLYFDTAEIFKKLSFEDKLKMSKYPTLSVPGKKVKLFKIPVKELTNKNLKIDLSDISNNYNELFVSLYWSVDKGSKLPTDRQFKFLKSMIVGPKDLISYDTTGVYPPMPFFYRGLLNNEISEEELKTIDCLAPRFYFE